MKRLVAMMLGFALGAGNMAFAQQMEMTPVTEAARANWEYGAIVQGGKGFTDNRDGYKFFSAGVHAGRVLTPEIGNGIFKGTFEYAMELYPFWQAYVPKYDRVNCSATPTAGFSPVRSGNTTIYCSQPFSVGGTYTGITLTPIILRWNLTHGRRLMPWVQGAGGVLWTNHKFPPYGSALPNQQNLPNDGPGSETSVWNFTPQAGVGIHYFVKPRRSIDFSANAIHISSASLGDRNPGVNASVQFTLGYSWWK